MVYIIVQLVAGVNIVPWVRKKKCIACKKCVRKCPVDAISMVKGKALIDNNECIGCGKCVRVCPVRAISGDKEKVIKEVKSNLSALRGALKKSKSRKLKKQIVRNRIEQLKMEKKILQGTMKELKKIKY